MYDLNVPWPAADYTTKASATDIINVKNIIVTLYNLGYRQIALNFQTSEAVKIPSQKDQMNPIPMDQLREELCGKFPNLRLFSRITVAVDDPSKCQGIAKLQQQFDILAVQPLNEKLFQLAIANLDIDLISFNFATKLPFFLKHKTVGSAIEKGIKFEVNYAQLINGYASSSTMFKRFFINNVLLLIRTSRSKGIVVSSGAFEPVQTRSANDIMTVLTTLGLDDLRSKACVTVNPERVLVNGRLRVKSYKQMVVSGDGMDVLTSESGGKKRLAETPGGRLLKKKRTEKGN